MSIFQCNDSLSFEECELALLRHITDQNELKIKEKNVQNDEIIKIISIIETFLQEKKLICYGGTAINNILSNSKQFYDMATEIPDYDFYSTDPVNDAMELADVYFQHGFTSIEAKAGSHYGTYKVFVNYIPIADITLLHSQIYLSIQKDAIVMNNIRYAPPNFLRMNMYLELSRPLGDVSRWEKVLKRLTLLNTSYPIVGYKCDPSDDDIQSETEIKIHNIVKEIFIQYGVVFFGGYASSLYNNFVESTIKAPIIHEFDVIYVDIEKLSGIIKETLLQNNITNVEIIHHTKIGEIIPMHNEIKVNDKTVAYIYVPIACHGYNVINTASKSIIKVATLDTMLTFFISFYYADVHTYRKNKIMCLVQYLFEIQQQNRLSQNSILKRFALSCYGKQDQLKDIRFKKNEKFKELKHNKLSAEYVSWFLAYTPDGQKHPSHENTFKESNQTILDTQLFPTVPKGTGTIGTTGTVANTSFFQHIVQFFTKPQANPTTINPAVNPTTINPIVNPATINPIVNPATINPVVNPYIDIKSAQNSYFDFNKSNYSRKQKEVNNNYEFESYSLPNTGNKSRKKHTKSSRKSKKTNTRKKTTTTRKKSTGSRKKSVTRKINSN
jgi:hypothetical protein